MKLVKGTLMGIGAVALIASLMSIVAPKAVHAAVAALVQVANTPTTAVPTVAAPAASQLYQAFCQSQSASPLTCAFSPVPAGQTLFVESASILSASQTGADPSYAFIGEFVGSNFVNVLYIPMVQQASFNTPFAVAQFTDDFTGAVAGRIWFKAGMTPECSENLSNLNGSGQIFCSISGYLVPAQ